MRATCSRRRRSRRGSIGRSHVLVDHRRRLQGHRRHAAAASLAGPALDGIVAGGQPLFLFGDRAGVMEVEHRRPGLVRRRRRAPSSDAAPSLALVPQDAVFAEWRTTVSLNVTLFVLTAGVLLIILYAYFSQAARAQAADRIYLEAHQRIDLALVRGRCGLWDWDMVRGKMYWSRSMYDMLGYGPATAMLSFGEVAEIIHADDGDLFELANRIVVARDRPHRPGVPHAPRQTANGSGCAPAPRSSTRRRRKSS